MAERKNKVKVVCKNCNKTAPYDMKTSNPLWMSYDKTKPCQRCGCKEYITVLND